MCQPAVSPPSSPFAASPQHHTGRPLALTGKKGLFTPAPQGVWRVDTIQRRCDCVGRLPGAVRVVPCCVLPFPIAAVGFDPLHCPPISSSFPSRRIQFLLISTIFIPTTLNPICGHRKTQRVTRPCRLHLVIHRFAFFPDRTKTILKLERFGIVVF